MENLIYKVEDINKVLNYLGNKPFIEVSVLIQILQNGAKQTTEKNPIVKEGK